MNIIYKATVGLAVLAVAAQVNTYSARASNKPPAPSMAVVANGKQLAMKCVGCHGDNLKGRTGFSPSITPTGVLKEYKLATFVRVLNTGVTNDGGHVKPPMPVYHMFPPQSLAIYAYLKTLK